MASSESAGDMEEQAIPVLSDNDLENQVQPQPTERVFTVPGINEETQRDYDSSRKIFIRCSIMAIVFGALMCALVCFWMNELGGAKWGSNNMHTILMTVFMVFFQGIGTIIFRMLPTLPKLTVKLIHAGFHLIALLGLSLGFYMAWNTKEEKKQNHFFSFHSWIGIIAISLFYAQFLAGLFVFRLYTPMAKANVVVPYHHFMGCFIFFFSCIANVTGIMIKAAYSIKNYTQRPTLGYYVNLCGLYCSLFFLIIMYLLTDTRFKRRVRPDA